MVESTKLLKPLRRLALAILPLAFSGCVCLSIHPLYTADDTVFEPALLGTWVLATEAAQLQDSADNAPTTFEFSDAGDGAYTLKHSQDGVSALFQAYLLRIGDSMFLDLYPDRSDEQLDTTWLYTFQLLGMHQFFYVEQIEPQLIVRELNYSWLDGYMQENPEAIKHEAIYVDADEPFYVLTAQPAELQQFYAAQLETKGAYFTELEDRTYVKVAEASMSTE